MGQGAPGFQGPAGSRTRVHELLSDDTTAFSPHLNSFQLYSEEGIRGLDKIQSKPLLV